MTANCKELRDAESDRLTLAMRQHGGVEVYIDFPFVLFVYI